MKAELVLSPQGRLYFNEGLQATEVLPEAIFAKLSSLFKANSFLGLLHLGILEFSLPLPTSFAFWQSFSRKFIVEACKLSQIDNNTVFLPPRADLEKIVNQTLFIQGIEYLQVEVLMTIWQKLLETLKEELAHFSSSLQEYLNKYNARWNAVGRVYFHLAENKKDEQRPFAFLATYTTHLSQQAVEQHLPLKRALQDYAGEQNHSALLKLLLPVQKASEQSLFIKNLVDSGDVFQTKIWSAREAHSFLKDIPLMESSGVIVRVPDWWNVKNPPRPRVKITIGENQKSVGIDALLDFNMHLALNDEEPLSPEDLSLIFNASENLIKIKEKWVEIDRTKLENVLSHWKKLQQGAKNGVSIAEGMRLLAGLDLNSSSDKEKTEETTPEWSTVTAGSWLTSVLDQLRNPATSENEDIEKVLKHYLLAKLRPYQLAGVKWLWLLYQLNLGGCLADDMGLGKTIQVLSLLLLVKYLSNKNPIQNKISLLVVPASLLGNWQAEIIKFSPEIKILIAHSSTNPSKDRFSINSDNLTHIDLVITTYGNVYRLEWLKEIKWNLLILDEAQLIKNPDTKQTRSVKSLKSCVRFALTGTPIENRLGDLWSLFDFTSPGLLSSKKKFADYAKQAGKDNASPVYKHFISSLRSLTQPYILRRLKNDKKIISDLPDKTEVQSYCFLTKDQIHLYQQAIKELSHLLKEAEGINRQGIILSYLIRFKQICNHPAQWLGYGDYDKKSSGKFLRLKEICEEIVEKQEKVLVFTQFKEIIPHLANFLNLIFGKEGLTLHGSTPIKKRAELVESFQQEQGPPFFVLSLKAGGTGLNLTQASHVIHFDRWWNPAVENQATDRAYRIGQKNPVLVHKFVCQGTIEEKIDDLINSKKQLSAAIIEDIEEMTLTQLSNEQLLNLISLDLNKAIGD